MNRKINLAGLQSWPVRTAASKAGRATLCAALILISSVSRPATSYAEWTYAQPYLGKDDPEWMRVNRGARAESFTLKQSVQKAEVIFLGRSTSLTVEHTQPATPDARPWYSGTVVVEETLKGRLDSGTLKLRWKPFPTGIEKTPSRHVFIASRDRDGKWEVDRALYDSDSGTMQIFEDRQFGNVDRQLGLMALRALVDEAKHIDGLKEKLDAAFRSSDSWIRGGAVMLALELNLTYSRAVLDEVVLVRDGRDYGYFQAIQRLASRTGVDGIRVILQGVPALREARGMGRLAESNAFWTIGEYGKADAFPVINDFIRIHPEYAASAASAIADIGGKGALEMVQSWQDDARIANLMETVPAFFSAPLDPVSAAGGAPALQEDLAELRELEESIRPRQIRMWRLLELSLRRLRLDAK